MSPLARIPLGLLVIAVGVHMVWKTDFYLDFSGPIDFAEQKFGPGGTRTYLKLFGVGVCFIGMAIATNLIADILGGIAGIFVRP
ncbi:hypothetical protein HY734_01830 [Candidatus Uhrbacteria bacterium]|nr:hypothetical protein [Candidatus Uhrbacteria bacterium]